MKALLRRGRPVAEAFEEAAPFAELLVRLSAWIRCFPGPLGLQARLGAAGSRSRPAGIADHSIFPLPLLRERRHARGHGRESDTAGLSAVRLTNLWIGVLNYLHDGRWGEVCQASPSAAQSRVLRSLRLRARGVLRRLPKVLPGVETIRNVLNASMAYGDRAGAVPLGTDAGIPHRAATVDTAAVLAADLPDLALQCEEPAALLLDPDEWPSVQARDFSLLAPDYPSLIDSAVGVGLEELMDAEQLAEVGGAPLVGGGFAVPKKGTETRWIKPSKVLNRLVDPRKLVAPRMPHLPQLGSVTTRAGTRLRVSKRDARHYFHVLRMGEKWKAFTAGPPVIKHGLKKFPVGRSFSMGFRGSAVMAQAVTDVVAARAQLPAEARIGPGYRAPSGMPVWGTIMDDFWMIGTDENTDEMLDAWAWPDRVEDQWEAVGVEPNAAKDVNREELAEVQGAEVDPVTHELGLSAEKCMDVLASLLYLAGRYRVPVRMLERAIGKVGHAHMFRVCLRSIFEKAYGIVREARAAKHIFVDNSVELITELYMAAVTLPLARMSLAAPWAPRVVAFDAAPGGHGLAYTSVEPQLVQEWARWACHRGGYVLLPTDDVQAPLPEHTNLQRVRLPLAGLRWHEIGRPGFYRNIALEEWAAGNWALRTRLERPAELGTRCVQLGDNSVQVGSQAKGRSSTRRVNRFCKQSAAIQIAGDLRPFILWTRSCDNPADRPSSWHGLRAQRAATSSEEPGVDLRAPQHAAAPKPSRAGYPRLAPAVFAPDYKWQALAFIHVCSGPRRRGDLAWWIERLAARDNVPCWTLSLDPRVSKDLDLLNDEVFADLRRWAWTGALFAMHGGAPCGTWSRLRWSPGGPPPVRDRTRPFGLPGLSPACQRSCDVGSELFLRQVDLEDGIMSCGGCACAEHPEDPKHAPYPSTFCTPQRQRLRARHGSNTVVGDQCRYGGATRKRTQWESNLPGLSCLGLRCNHPGGHGSQRGIRGDGTFFSAGTEIYPSALNQQLASLIVSAFAAQRDSVVIPARLPSAWRGLRGVLPTGLPARPLPQPAPDVWPLGPGGRLPPPAPAASDAGALQGCPRALRRGSGAGVLRVGRGAPGPLPGGVPP